MNDALSSIRSFEFKAAGCRENYTRCQTQLIDARISKAVCEYIRISASAEDDPHWHWLLRQITDSIDLRCWQLDCLLLETPSLHEESWGNCRSTFARMTRTTLCKFIYHEAVGTSTLFETRTMPSIATHIREIEDKLIEWSPFQTSALTRAILNADPIGHVGL